ncbi:hypothetical protein Tco_0469400 [Tanacetum coccineum]
MFSIVSEPVYDIILKNRKKVIRVMRHQEVYKFYDATLKRVLEGLKSYNNDVKHGYVTPSLSKEDVNMLLTRLFDHVIYENLKLSNDHYVLYDHVMSPLTAQQERKTRKNYGTKRGRPSTSTSSSSLFGQPSSSHHIDDDNDGNEEGASRVQALLLPLILSIPCLMIFLKSLQIHQILIQTWKPFTLVKPKS